MKRLFLVWLAVGCSSATRTLPVAPTTKAPPGLSSFSASLAPGMTIAEVWLRLQEAGARNIVRAKNPEGKNGVIEVIGADYFPDLYLFEGGKLKRTLGLGADRQTNVGMYMHIVSSGNAQAVVVISEAMRFRGEPMVAVLHDGAPAKRYLIAYDYFPQWFDGVVDPLIIGTDLDDIGVTLVARDRQGKPWKKAVMLRCDGTKVEATPIAMSEALRCECLRRWKEHTK